ncbi:MAG: biotin carboxylase [SAR324 cluster bacterium]|nr:biotin carboxylase [SAR324 cluster bacterium]MBL7036083.1 biotin carboxylase [SAR324 cluster bacterium]
MSAITFDPESSWQASFTFEHVKCLIVCRGPIRLETINIFRDIGADYGILLSEKDSIIYPQTLAPELRAVRNRREQVHHVQDYMGVTKEERIERILQIIAICQQHGYTHLFAGYGFMAEDAEFVARIENAGISFIGPNSRVIHQAGSKDEAKQLARSLNVSVTPGEDRIAALTLLRKAGKTAAAYFQELAQQHKLELPENWQSEELLEQAVLLLQASNEKHLELFSISELQQETILQVEALWQENPGRRIRFKHVGGGGGKGQRVVTAIDEVADAVMSVLIESKATGEGDNKNFLIELNIENTRHNEIQLLGNGKWCVELGGRDCSLQMHEQKLLEVSLTEEMLENAAVDYDSAGKTTQAEVLRTDAKILNSMCRQAEEFGQALKLDSVSTFECIVEGNEHYFMEVNTRIQVEHRVTEMVYKLKFANPDNPEDTFIVESLVAAMLLVNCYGVQLSRPQRLPRFAAGIEARLNATNPALKPHAGGIVRAWSKPGEHEIRDDQGIGISNPDTGLLQLYNLAGAYDSNVALSITNGISRAESFEKLAEILRCMEVRGHDLHLNVDFHYGLLHWLLGNDPLLKPNTSFVSSYLALAGKLKVICENINLDLAWKIHQKQVQKNYGSEGLLVYKQKITLILRPLKKLLSRTHLLMGWLAFQKSKNQSGNKSAAQNPVQTLKELYHYLRLEQHSGVPPSEQIWSNDQQLLDTAAAFYRDLAIKFGQPDMPWSELCSLLEQKKTPAPFSLEKKSELWNSICAAHKGHQMCLGFLQFPEVLAEQAGYYELRGNADLEIEIPADLLDHDLNAGLAAELAPRPPARSNEVLAWTGGTFYSRETPEADEYVVEGQHVEEGEVLGLLEVMKMFNQIRAEFSGTIQQVCVETASGKIVARGQTLFLIDPDVPAVTETEDELLQRQQEQTASLMQKIFPEN